MHPRGCAGRASGGGAFLRLPRGGRRRSTYKNTYFCDSGLSNGTKYYYKFFPYTTANAYTDSTDDEFNAIPTVQVAGKLPAADVTEAPHYHDTWTLLRKYRDVVWSLEVSVRQVRNRFRIDYGKTIEDFLESVYLAGADLSGTELEHQAKCIEQSHKMLCLVDSAVDLMRAKHKNGEEFYWLLYYSYLSPQELQNVEEIIDQLRPHIRDISTRTYYRKRKEAVEVLSSVLWGYTAQDSAGIVREFLQ